MNGIDPRGWISFRLPLSIRLCWQPRGRTSAPYDRADVASYIVTLVRRTRDWRRCRLRQPRARSVFFRCRALAGVEGAISSFPRHQDAPCPFAPPCSLEAEAELEGLNSDRVISEIFPRSRFPNDLLRTLRPHHGGACAEVGKIFVCVRSSVFRGSAFGFVALGPAWWFRQAIAAIFVGWSVWRWLWICCDSRAGAIGSSAHWEKDLSWSARQCGVELRTAGKYPFVRASSTRRRPIPERASELELLVKARSTPKRLCSDARERVIRD